MTETIKEICQRHGMGPTALSRRFGIPLRTVWDWHRGARKPPEYVVSMIAEILEMESEMEPIEKMMAEAERDATMREIKAKLELHEKWKAAHPRPKKKKNTE